jgi:hypothetical protein
LRGEAAGPGEAPPGDPNRLRLDLASRLARGDASLRFEVQAPRPGASPPIDRATVPWTDQDAPWVPTARLRLPKQDVNAEGQETYGETLAFSPWRTPEANRPLGSIAESRRRAYPASAALRHHVNGDPDAEPHAPRRP